MKAKKFFSTALLALAMTVSSNVSAEQPAAEEYRQMFRSGNFYVEYQVSREETGHEFKLLGIRLGGQKSNIKVLAGQDGKRLYRGSHDVISVEAEKVSNIYTNAGQYNRASSLGAVSSKKLPDLLYQNGKYYRLVSSLNGIKKTAYIVLPEDQLNSPVLDPNEEWQYVRGDLALPNEFAVFCWNEPFRDNTFNSPAPVYNSSSKKTAGKKEYDCDRYISEIKNLAGNVAAQEIYDMLYENGKLVLIQKYLKYNDKENFVREFKIKEITGTVPENTFTIGKKIKVYAAANGDMNDMLEQPVEVETLGGK